MTFEGVCVCVMLRAVQCTCSVSGISDCRHMTTSNKDSSLQREKETAWDARTDIYFSGVDEDRILVMMCSERTMSRMKRMFLLRSLLCSLTVSPKVSPLFSYCFSWGLSFVLLLFLWRALQSSLTVSPKISSYGLLLFLLRSLLSSLTVSPKVSPDLPYGFSKGLSWGLLLFLLRASPPMVSYCFS